MNILKEIYYFGRSNFFLTFLPVIAIFFSQIGNLSTISITDILKRFIGCMIYILLLIYQANVGNQISGVVEDLINKPERPLVSGLISIREAKVHLISSTIIFLVFGFQCGFIFETISWIIFSYLLNYTEHGKHGIWKNVMVYPYSYFILSTTCCFANNISDVSLIKDHFHLSLYILIHSFNFVIMVPMQDLRDVKGDTVSGRRTLPIIFGMDNCLRVLIICCSIALIISCIYEFIIFPVNRLLPTVVCLPVNIILLIIIIIRLVRRDDTKFTYEFFLQFWFMMVGASAPMVNLK
jgi:4-hydroxybenzoate polyprenyltransferase